MSYDSLTVIDIELHIREIVDVDHTYRAYIERAFRDAFEKLYSAVIQHR